MKTMKRRMITMVMMMAIAVSAAAMSYSKARSEALFLSDKMAYELGLSAAQYEAVYEINLDYLMSVNHSSDIFGSYWARRNADMLYVLNSYQYGRYASIAYFYRPLDYVGSAWRFNIYSRYTNRSLFYYARPTVYVSYRGGHNTGRNSYYAGRSFGGKVMNVHYGSNGNGKGYKNNNVNVNVNVNTGNWHSANSVKTGNSGKVVKTGNSRSFGNGRFGNAVSTARSAGNTKTASSGVQRFGGRK